MIPNLPTDNLYKFMALSGVAIIIFTIYINTLRSREYSDHIIGYYKEKELTSSKIKVLNQKLNKITKGYTALCDIEKQLLTEDRKKRIADVLRKNKKPFKTNDYPTSNEELEFEKKLDKLSDKTSKNEAEYDMLVDEVNNSLVEVKSHALRINLLYEDLKRLSMYNYIFLSFGVILIIIGFYLWYQKVQRHLDVILVNDRKKSDNSNSRLRKKRIIQHTHGFLHR